ncbi:Aldehyde dehydrogenase family protein [Pseudomonas amygdali pv. mori]|nr:Aldehyde dehydrogenase family protein [Pseudomonas amygdali pv. mori]
MSAEPEFIDKAAEGLVLAFFNQGEVCTCPSRALVQESIYPQFMEAVMRKVEKIKRGDPLDTDTMVGAQASEQQFDKILSYLDIAKGEGAELLTGGKVEKLEGSLSTGYYIQPTLLKGNNKMRVFQEEIFGPVVSVTTFKDEAEAVAIANDTEFGLASYFYAQNMSRVFRVAEALEYGMVGINTGLISNELAPFGGIKSSGLGREGSKYGIEDYLEIKYLCLSV